MMTIPASLITDNAERIAQFLNRRLSPKRLSGPARDALRHALIAARGDGDVMAFVRAVERVSQAIHPVRQRSWVISKLLLESAWLIPPNSLLEDAAAQCVRDEFDRCRASDANRFKSLREEQIALQRSSFPVVRRLVAAALRHEPVDDAEIAMLNDPLLSHDTRASISSRIMVSQKTPFFDDVLDYYIDAARRFERNRTDATLKRVIDSLKNKLDLYRSDDLMAHLLGKYVSHFNDPVMGRLLMLLRSYGVPLVNHVLREYGNPESAGQRPAFARLLAHMAEHAHVQGAVKAMTQLLLDPHVEDDAQLVVSFHHAAQRTASQGPYDSSGVSAAFQEAIERFEASNRPHLQDLAQSLKGVEWGEEIGAEIVEQYLRGELPEDQSPRIRYCGAEGVEALAKAAKNAGRPVQERLIATRALGKLVTSRMGGVACDAAWDVYRLDTETSVRAAALEVAVHRHRPFTDLERHQLLQEYRNSTGVLRLVFEKCTEILFPPEMLDFKPHV